MQVRTHSHEKQELLDICVPKLELGDEVEQRACVQERGWATKKFAARPAAGGGTPPCTPLWAYGLNYKR